MKACTIFIVLAFLIGCGRGKRDLKTVSNLSTAAVGVALENIEYDSYSIAIDIVDEGGKTVDSQYSIPLEHHNKDALTALKKTFMTGSYIMIFMEIRNKGKVIASTEKCLNQEIFKIDVDPNKNRFNVYLCTDHGGGIETKRPMSEVEITPKIKNGGSSDETPKDSPKNDNELLLQLEKVNNASVKLRKKAIIYGISATPLVRMEVRSKYAIEFVLEEEWEKVKLQVETICESYQEHISNVKTIETKLNKSEYETLIDPFKEIYLCDIEILETL